MQPTDRHGRRREGGCGPVLGLDGGGARVRGVLLGAGDGLLRADRRLSQLLRRRQQVGLNLADLVRHVDPIQNRGAVGAQQGLGAGGHHRVALHVLRADMVDEPGLGGVRGLSSASAAS